MHKVYSSNENQQNLRTEPKEKRITQAQLATAANVGRKLINALEKGRLNDIGYARLLAITAALGLEIDIRRPERLHDAWL